MQPQTVYLPTENVTVVYATTLPKRGGSSDKFNHRAGAITGWIQLCCGMAAVVVGIAGRALSSYIGLSFFGIWAGVLIYVPTGILGIVSAKKRTSVIISYMVMSIISAVLAGPMTITGAAGAPQNECEDYDYFYKAYRYCSENYDEYGDNEALVNGRVAADALLGFVGVIELVTAIVAAVYCCRGIRCCCRQTPSTQSTVVYQPAVPEVAAHNAPGFQQPLAQMAPVQPAPMGAVPPQYPAAQPPPYAPDHQALSIGAQAQYIQDQAPPMPDKTQYMTPDQGQAPPSAATEVHANIPGPTYGVDKK